MSGFHPIASTAVALHYKAGTIPLIVFVGVSASLLALLLLLGLAASSRFAASKLANALVTLAWIAAIPLCLLAAFGIIVTWADSVVALDCIRGDAEYPCPSRIEALSETFRTIALLGLPAVIVLLTRRHLKNGR